MSWYTVSYQIIPKFSQKFFPDFPGRFIDGRGWVWVYFFRQAGLALTKEHPQGKVATRTLLFPAMTGRVRGTGHISSKRRPGDVEKAEEWMPANAWPGVVVWRVAALSLNGTHVAHL